MSNLKRKLTSRKLWASIAGFVAMLIVYFTGDNNNAQQVTALIMAGASVIGYVIGEGLADTSTTITTVNPDDLVYDPTPADEVLSSEDGEPIGGDE
jgi:hypothetical protein